MVLLHVCASVVNSGPAGHVGAWWTAHLIESATRWCVPVFVMVSGALLLSRPIDSPPEFYRRRAARRLVPLVVWTVVYLALRAYWARGIDMADLATSVITGVPYYHLWYLYMLLGLYLMTPFIHRFVASASTALRTWFVMIAFAIASLDDIGSHLSPGGAAVFLVMFLPFVPYFVAGHLLRDMPASSPAATLLATAGGCAAGIAIVGGLMVPRWDHIAWEVMYSYLNPLVIVMSLCVFRFGISQPLKSQPAAAWVQRLAPLTLGIYLIHPLWLELLRRVGLYGSALHPAVGIPATTLVAFSLSAASTALLGSLPYVRASVR